MCVIMLYNGHADGRRCCCRVLLEFWVEGCGQGPQSSSERERGHGEGFWEQGLGSWLCFFKKYLFLWCWRSFCREGGTFPSSRWQFGPCENTDSLRRHVQVSIYPSPG